MTASAATSSTRLAASTDRIACVPVVELRRRPDHRSECVGEALMGSRLLVLGERGEGRWLRVAAPDGYRAWARSWGTVPARGGWPERGIAVRAPADLIRSTPDRAGDSISPVTMGCRLHLLDDRARGWRAVATPDGRRGWLPTSALESDRLGVLALFWGPVPPGGPRPLAEHFAAASLARIIERARDLLGAPYRWGGMSASGLDCSGFVRLLFGLEGIPMPRDARDQEEATARWRVPIEAGRARAGDLVFFGEASGSADHVALGLGGRAGRVIHASGRVRVSGLARTDPLCEDPLRARVRAVMRPSWRG